MALSSGLIAYWKMDETSGTNANDEVGSNDLTLGGVTVNQTEAKLGKSFWFDGGDYADFTSAPTSGLSELTISMWVNSYSSTATRALWTEENALTYFQNTIQENSWSTRDTTAGEYGTRQILDTTEPVEDVWEHRVYVYSSSGGYKRVYINNSLDAEVNTTLAALTSVRDGMLSIGICSDSAPKEFYGYIDEVGLWNRALSTTEIAELYNSGSGYNGFLDPVIGFDAKFNKFLTA